MTTTTTHRLFDADTGDDIGPATPAQIAASDASEAKGEGGHFLIDGDGDVVDPMWAGRYPYAITRRVYTLPTWCAS